MDDRKEYFREYNKNHKKEKKLYRENNKEKIRLQRKEYRENHKEEIRLESKEYYKNHKEEKRKYSKQHNLKNKEKISLQKIKYLKELRMKCLIHYSNKFNLICNCCGMDDIDILTIDHINGGGKKHLKEIGVQSGVGFYRWILKNNFPEGFQVLCWNCNCGKGQKIICPHKLSKDELSNILNNNHYKYRRIPALKKISNGIIKCVNCRESNILFLSIDHVNGGGKAQKRDKFNNSSTNFITFIKNSNIINIEEYQILCYNCNILKYIRDKKDGRYE